MPSSVHNESAASLRASGEELLHWLAGAAVHCAIGLVLGAFVASAMRKRHLHWSWAAAALGMIVLARPSLRGWWSVLALAALLAASRGRRWQREDVQAGADLAEIAAQRTTPADLLHRLARATAQAARRRLAAGSWQRACELQLGVDERGRAVSIPFADGAGARGAGGAHILVVGATGSGKTVTQSWIAVNAIARGMGAVVVDPKGDGHLREHLRGAALVAGRPFIEWTPAGEWVYNPYARGGASEIADKLLAGERFTEPHYLRQAQRYLGHAVRALRELEVEVSLEAIVEHLDPECLEQLARALPEGRARATFTYLDGLSSRQRSDLAGVRDRLAILAESDVGAWLDPRTPAERFDLLGAVQARAVVYFNLECDSRPLLSAMLGGAIVQDLQTTVAALQGAPVPTLVAIDEFSAVAAEQVVRLFGRARSAGFSLLLGTQELSDLRPPGRERLLEQVLGNLSVVIAHRQVVPSSAELIASVAGTEGAWRVTRHSDGRSTRIRVREHVLAPDRVMGLSRGWAAVVVLVDGHSAHLARMFAPPPLPATTTGREDR